MTIILPDNRKPQPPATVLRGPADADAFRVKVGRYGERWYTDSLPGCPIAPASEANFPSVSAVKKAKPFEGADYVAMKRIATDLSEPNPANLPSHYAPMYEYFKSVNKLGLDAAGKRGSHVHKMAEQMLYGQPVSEAGPGAHYRGALEDFFATYQPTLVAAEFVCIHRTLNDVGYGGTSDAIVELDGQRYLVDWKSRSEDGDHAAYPEEGAQLAAYAMAEYIVGQGPNGMAERLIRPELDGALIVSVRPDGTRIYPVNIAAAWDYMQRLHGWWITRRTEKDLVGRPWPTKTAVEQPKPVPVPVETPVLRHADGTPLTELENLYEESAALGEWLAESDGDEEIISQRLRLSEIERRIAELEAVAVEQPLPAAPATVGGGSSHGTTPDDSFAGLVVEPTVGVATARTPYVAPVASEPTWTAQAAPEGAEVDAKTIGRLTAGYERRTPQAKAVIGALIKDAQRAGVAFGQVEKNPTERRFELGRACLWIADHTDGDEELVRAAMRLVVGDIPPVHSAPIGAVLGTFTPDEARTLCVVLEGISDGTYVADFSTNSLLLRKAA